MSIFIAGLLPISLSESNPWKLRIWKNVPLFIFVVLDFLFVTVVFFNTKYFTSIDILEIDIKESLQFYLTALATVVLSITYSTIIKQTKLYRKQYEFGKVKPNLKLKQLTHSI